MSGRFAGKSIIITGGGAGLGHECALQWGAEGEQLLSPMWSRSEPTLSPRRSKQPAAMGRPQDRCPD